jgi:hypothetical protein
MVEKQTPEGEVLTEEESLEAQSDREESEEDQD